LEGDLVAEGFELLDMRLFPALGVDAAGVEVGTEVDEPRFGLGQ